MTKETKETKDRFYKTAKSYWWIIVFIFGLGSWVTTVELSQAANGKKNESQDKAIDRIGVVLEGQHQLMEKNARLMEKMSGQIDLILRLIGIKVTDSLKKHWEGMPRALVIDAFGNPSLGCEWISISDDYLYARTYKWVNNDSLLVRVEWDKRELE